MKIACLGWGSLIWDPRTLPVRKPWFNDGPILPIEFARHSKGDRITLVITPNVKTVRTLWALMSVSDINEAKNQLAEREGITEEYISQSIGVWEKDCQSSSRYSNLIEQWAGQMELDFVIWTNLRPKFEGILDKVPTIEEIVSFIENDLSFEQRKCAEEYVRKTPLQINSDYRRQLEITYNWTPLVNENNFTQNECSIKRLIRKYWRLPTFLKFNKN